MDRYLVIGAGAIGALVATQLAEQGHDVRVLTRSGSGPEREGVERIAGDASRATDAARHAGGCAAIFNCANPAYHRWPSDWPPIAASLLGAAEATGASLVTLSNLYAYGRPRAPMTPHDPLSADYEKAQVRATMWREAKAAHDDGRLRATEVRASDFIGPVAQSYLGSRLVPRVLAHKSCQVLGDPDVLHSWNYTADVARALVTCAQDDRSWGRAWHAPANPARSMRDVLDDVADLAGTPRVKVTSMPRALLRLAGLFSTTIRELPETLYQFEVPFVIDDAETRETFGLAATPWPDVLKATIAPYV